MAGLDQPVLPNYHFELRMFRWCVNSAAWRVRMQRRTSAIAANLRLLELAMGDRYVRRERGEKRTWTMIGKRDDGEQVPVVRIHLGPAKTLLDLGKPLDVLIIEPQLINLTIVREGTRVVTEEAERGVGESDDAGATDAKRASGDGA